MNPRTALALLLGLAPLTPSAATLEERVEALEQRDAELYHTLEEKKSVGLMTQISERLSISGLLEVEASYERLDLLDGDDESSSDLVLATAQLGFQAAVTEHISATLVFLFEEDETDPPEVDEGYVGYARSGWIGRFGRQYVPFGEYPSHFISDPLTLELGETRETAILLGYEHELFSLSAFLFNGDAEKVNGAGEPEDDHLKDWGVSAKVMPTDFLELGASLLSDLADTDAALVSECQDRVPGWSAFVVAVLDPIELSGEILGAVDSFDAADLDADEDGSGDRPLAWNLELAWDVMENVEIAARLEGSRELAGAPELQCGATVSWGPWEYVSLSLEYLHGEFDEDFGVDEDDRALGSRDLFTSQLAVEF
ncbi:MAG: LbtU family siderophore porin [Proteobacteria bacterium]|nr:LbtU family siderophore porin [Pseudomonadota bacterium]